jgi:Cdc6-like AAA superfamily ATPase
MSKKKKAKKENLKFIVNLNNQRVVVGEKPPKPRLEFLDTPKAGFYKTIVIQTLFGHYCEFEEFKVDLPATAEKSSKLILDTDEINQLFSESSLRIHKAMGNPAKIGFLLHGKQGTGKTTAMYAVCQTLIDTYGATIIEANNVRELQGAYKHIKQLRLMQPDLMVAIVMDECEEAMKQEESSMKLLLDSKDTPSNFIFIGATNYLEKIPLSIRDRPSRITHSIDCSKLNNEEEIVYVLLNDMNKKLNPLDMLPDKVIKEMTRAGLGQTIDQLKHLFLNNAIKLSEAKKPKVKTKHVELEETCSN